MCLGIPGRVTKVWEDMAEVDFGGVKRQVNTMLCPDVREGDYVLVHVGFAITKLEEQEALETLRLLEQYLGAEEGVEL